MLTESTDIAPKHTINSRDHFISQTSLSAVDGVDLLHGESVKAL